MDSSELTREELEIILDAIKDLRKIQIGDHTELSLGTGGLKVRSSLGGGSLLAKANMKKQNVSYLYPITENIGLNFNAYNNKGLKGAYLGISGRF